MVYHYITGKGRQTVKITDVFPGDVLLADDGFTCLNADEECFVYGNGGRMYVLCACGEHFLEGQLEDDEYVGFRKKS